MKHNKEFWDKLSSLYEKTASLSEQERTLYLEKNCSDNELRKELEAIYSVSDTSAEYFDSLESNINNIRTEELSNLPPLSGKVGNYLIRERVGRGGMGTVYLAERADQTYESKVAIKILRRGLDSDDVLARFHIERQILARLNHPNITHLLDGGITSDGRPYFVMEYVEGVAISDWCDEKKLSIRQRIELFFQVCDALQYAHQNLVIHRDLKPGNILVTKEGQVKLLDFGIAKLLDEDAGAPVTEIKTGNRLMTPEYASPEQVYGKQINTSSDIYQIGLVLYELVCGQPAYLFSDRSYTEIERVILKEQPVKPSQKFSQADSAKRSEISIKRSETEKQLKNRLKGDIDVIILKALNKETERRFASVNDLKEDLLRHLRGLPVHSQGDGFRYKTGKFLVRNKVAAAMTAGLIILLSVLGVFYSHTITQERNRALMEAERSDQIKNFMVDLMHSLDPSEVRGEPVSATLLLDRGAERVLESDHQNPAVRGELLLTMADVYQSLDLHSQSQNLLDALFKHLDNSTHTPEMALLSMRAKKQQGFLHSERGEYLSALKVYEELKVEIENHYPDEKNLIASFYSDYALNYRVMGELAKADSLFQIALEKSHQIYDSRHPDLTRVMSRYATVLSEAGDFEAARKYQQQVLFATRENFGEIHPQVLREINNLATSHSRLGEYTEADILFGEAYPLALRLYNEDHTIISIIRQNHASVKSALGFHEEALEMYEEVLDLRKTSETYYHPTTGFTTMAKSNVLLKLERFKEAREHAELTFELLGFGLPEHHWAYDLARVLLSEAVFQLNEMTQEQSDKLLDSYQNLKSARGENDEHTLRALALLEKIDL